MGEWKSRAVSVSKKIIFDEVKRLRGGKPFTQAEVISLDRAIDEALRSAQAAVPAPRPSQGLGRRVTKAMVDKMHGFEGCRLEAYPDPGSRDGHPWTIGYGATGPGIGPGVVWTQEQADARFLSDLAKFEDGVTRLIGSAPTTQAQFDSLVSLAFNIGLDEDADTIAEGLGDSTLLRKHKAGDFEGAAKAFLSWRFNDGREMAGLKKRRQAEAAHYRGAV
jgi:lysozyme